ncbi:MAG TPA: MipA/OmpV family protein [Sphingomonas sp.]|nr:MipA/OmpV family protein [Sphingomonas sp.]
MRAIATRAFCLAAALLAAAPAAAQSGGGQSDKGLQGILSAGAGFVPDYEGSSRSTLVPYAEARVNLGNYYAAFEGNDLRFNVIDSSHFHAGPLIGFRRARNDVDSKAVSLMRRVDHSFTAGGFVEYEHIAADPRSGESVTLSAGQSVIGADSGITATLRAEAHRPLKFIDPGLIATVELDSDWANRDYMRTYFDVDPADSAASGLPVFHARSGFKSVGAAIAVDQFLSRKWAVGVRFHYARLLGDAADSPVTSIAGSPNQTFVGFVLSYVL